MSFKFIFTLRVIIITGKKKLDTYKFPQSSILTRLLFKINVHDIFLILKTTYFTGYADGSMPFEVGDDTTDALKPLE